LRRLMAGGTLRGNGRAGEIAGKQVEDRVVVAVEDVAKIGPGGSDTGSAWARGLWVVHGRGLEVFRGSPRAGRSKAGVANLVGLEGSGG